MRKLCLIRCVHGWRIMEQPPDMELSSEQTDLPANKQLWTDWQCSRCKSLLIILYITNKKTRDLKNQIRNNQGVYNHVLPPPPLFNKGGKGVGGGVQKEEKAKLQNSTTPTNLQLLFTVSQSVFLAVFKPG